MRKKVFMAVVITAIVAVSGWNVSQSGNEVALSDMALANVEALADEGSDCHYSNGYRSFSGSNGGAYDCCMIWKNGNASNDCN